MSTRDAGFSKPLFNCTGDLYVDRAAATASTHGRGDRGVRQFLTAPAKKGRTANTIGYGPLDFKPLFDSGKEPYEDPHKKYVRQRREGVQKFRTPGGFGYSSPSKKNGTFRGIVEHRPDGLHEQRGRRKKSDFQRSVSRNILSSPGKRGGYGVLGTLIGQKEIEYMNDPYDARRLLEQFQQKEEKNKTLERKPFVSTSGSKEFFSTAAVTDEEADADAAAVLSLAESMTPKERVAAQLAENEVTIFRPSSPPKAGAMGTINPFPDHQSDLFDERRLRRSQTPLRRLPVKDQQSYYKISDQLRDRKAFQPASGSRSMLQPPIATSGVKSAAVFAKSMSAPSIIAPVSTSREF